MPTPRDAETEERRLLDRVETGTFPHQPSQDAQTFTFATEKPADSGFAPVNLTTDAWAKIALWALIILSLLGLGIVAAFVFLDIDYITPDYNIKFLVVGDWGREGNSNQTAVADAMARLARKWEPDFIISTGDNFYESGLTSVEDPQFSRSFSEVYKDKSLQVQWHAILGNHDYGETWPWNESSSSPPQCGSGQRDCYYSPLHQLDIRLVERDWRWHCERFFTLSLARSMFTPMQVEIFFIDTNPALPEYHEAAWADRPGGIAEQSWPSQVRELEYRLSKSKARWKIVVGHHPVRNNRMAPIPSLMQDLEPLLRKYGVRAYFSGHEHCLEHLHVPGEPTHYFVSGGGSLTDYPVMLTDYGGSQWQHQGSGFAAVELEDDEIEVKFYGVEGDKRIYKSEFSFDEER